ncbi:MAG: hypothetical protein V7641_4553 [Blastocatellia bacterium]
MEGKRVTILRAGGVASTELYLMPGDTAEQLCTMVAREFGLPEGGTYRLLGADGNQITGEVYNVVKEGDKLNLAQIGEGG